MRKSLNPYTGIFATLNKRSLRKLYKKRNWMYFFQSNCTRSAVRIDLNNQEMSLKKEEENLNLPLGHNIYLVNLTKNLLLFSSCK